MKKFQAGLIVLCLTAPAAFAQSLPMALSIEQQNKLSEIVTSQTPQPLGHTDFQVAIGAVVPANVALRPLPSDAEALAPQLHGASYLAVEELVAVVDTPSRKIVSVMQRMRPQQTTGSGR
jgi:hypothetical protein